MIRIVLTVLLLSVSLGLAGEKLVFSDLSGKKHSPFSDEKVKAVVVVFITTDCPVANYFQPTLRRLGKAYQDRGVRFFMVHSDRDTTVDAAKKHAKEYGIEAPVVLDHAQTLAKELKAKWTPEAVVLTRDAKPVYRGRVNDTYADYGKKRPKPTKEDLREAIDRVLMGEPGKLVTSKVVGCPIFFEG